MKRVNNPIVSYIPEYLEYLEIEKGLAQLSVKNYDRFLKKFKDWLNTNNKGLRPHQLSPEMVSKYRLYLAYTKSDSKNQENLKKSTQNYYLIALRSFLNYLVDKDIESLPPEKIKLAKDNSKERVVKFLSLNELERLLLAPDTKTLTGLRDRTIMEALYSTGLRIAELTALNCEQFNLNILNKLDSYELTIVGKGGHARTVYFSPRCLDFIKKYLNKRKDMETALFISHRKIKNDKSDKRLTNRSVQNILKKYSKMAGLPITATPHTLRHTYATDLLNQGVDLRTVQEFLGHQNIMTTQIYTHVTNKRLKDIHKKFHSGKNLKV